MGHLHPLTQFIRHSLRFFENYGFRILESDEVISEWYNFDALNVPASHPSRDVQDTFWVESHKDVLRTHTTGSELKLIKENKIKPPFRIVVPGRCFRNERTDNTHEHTFYQIDGIIVDKNINMTHLIGVLSEYFKFLYGNKVGIRVRPHLFPFVEPGLEMDIKLADSNWREMLGAGMAHPVVLKNMGIDPEKWQAAMWGPGIDRFAMIKYGIDDIRKFHSQDLRFLKQF